MTMDIRDLQSAIGVAADGEFGPVSRRALLALFTTSAPKGVTIKETQAFADKLGCTLKQLRAVAVVESSGAGFDRQGRPKMLFERHLFHRLTNGQWSVTAYSDPTGGGYSDDSWAKLADACARDPDAAFAAASWGRFQVLGMHWSKLGYASSFDLARSTIGGEAGHYELLARYVLTFGLAPALRKLSVKPSDCEAFAAAYNGPGFRRFSYHTKLAEAMR